MSGKNSWTSENVQNAIAASNEKIAAGERIGALPDIPESARLALEYAIWVCEKEGRTFQNGTTAAWWDLCSRLAKHLG